MVEIALSFVMGYVFGLLSYPYTTKFLKQNKFFRRYFFVAL